MSFRLNFIGQFDTNLTCLKIDGLSYAFIVIFCLKLTSKHSSVEMLVVHKVYVVSFDCGRCFLERSFIAIKAIYRSIYIYEHGTVDMI